MSDNLLSRLRAEGHHEQADQIERKEIAADLRAKGNHQLANQMEAASRPPSPFGENGAFDPDTVGASRAADLAQLTRELEDQANGPGNITDPEG